MSIHKADYRTNRADYAIAAKQGDSDRDDILARKKKSLWLRDRRSTNPSESSPDPKAKPRGSCAEHAEATCHSQPAYLLSK